MLTSPLLLLVSSGSPSSPTAEKEFVDASLRLRVNNRLFDQHSKDLSEDLARDLEDVRQIFDKSEKQDRELKRFDSLLRLFSLRLERESSLPVELLKPLEDNLFDSQILFERLKTYFETKDRLVKLKGEIAGVVDARSRLKYRLLNFQKLSNLLKDYLGSITEVFTLRFILNEIEKERELNKEDGGIDPKRLEDLELESVKASRGLEESLAAARAKLPIHLKKINILLESLEANPSFSDSEALLVVSVRDALGSVFDENLLLREEFVNFLTSRAYRRVAKRLDEYYSGQYHFNFGVSNINLPGFTGDLGVMLNRRADLPVNEFFLRMFAQQLAGAVKHGAWFTKLHPYLLKNKNGESPKAG